MASPGDSYSPSYMFSVDNFGALNTLIQRLVESTCPNCTQVEKSDVIFFIDAREKGVTEEEFQLTIKTVSHIVQNMPAFGINNGQRVGIFLFGQSDSRLLKLSDDLRQNEMLVYIQTLTRQENNACYDITCDLTNNTFGQSLQFVIENYFNSSEGGRDDARKFIIIATSGRFQSSDDINMSEINDICNNKNVSRAVLGPGYDVDMNGLMSLVTEPSHAYVTRDEEDMDHLNVLQSEFTYMRCK